MIRNLTILALSLALLACLYGGIYRSITAETQTALSADRPELEWLRQQYEISDDQFVQIRAKHEAHDVLCRQLCSDLVEAKHRLDDAIATSPAMDETVQLAFDEWAAQRRLCREAAIRHMYDISSAMDPTTAEKYRARLYEKLIVPGRMPHVDQNGDFQEALIEHATHD